MSYEQFSAFLANIKELNAQKQTREVLTELEIYHFICLVEICLFSQNKPTSIFMFLFQETLRKAEEIFGADNKDLYLLFQGLLNRNTK